MATWHTCWRCKTRMPFLDEGEWARIYPVLRDYTDRVQAYREQTGAELPMALQHVQTDASEVFAELTGFTDIDVQAIWHHQKSLYGSSCIRCGELVRTPRAARCASCGQSVHPAS
jgi:hypothetical protein